MSKSPFMGIYRTNMIFYKCSCYKGIKFFVSLSSLETEILV